MHLQFLLINVRHPLLYTLVLGLAGHSCICNKQQWVYVLFCNYHLYASFIPSESEHK